MTFCIGFVYLLCIFSFVVSCPTYAVPLMLCCSYLFLSHIQCELKICMGNKGLISMHYSAVQSQIADYFQCRLGLLCADSDLSTTRIVHIRILGVGGSWYSTCLNVTSMRNTWHNNYPSSCQPSSCVAPISCMEMGCLLGLQSLDLTSRINMFWNNIIVTAKYLKLYMYRKIISVVET